MKYKIAIVDDHQIVIDGLILLIQGNEELEIIWCENNPLTALEKLATNPVDILISDVMMPQLSGVELSKKVKQLNPKVKILVLSMNNDGAIIFDLLEKEIVEGFLLKTADKKELNQALIQIGKGGTYFSEEVQTEFKKYKKTLEKNEALNLTSREIEVLQLIAKDYGNKKIALALYISERTVETHRKNIMRKTNTHTVVSLLDYAQKNKLV